MVRNILGVLIGKARTVGQRWRFFRDNVRIARGSYIAPEVLIGRYTRINAPSHIGPCAIGSFCAIGGRLVVRSTDHYSNYLNIQAHFQNAILRSNLMLFGKSKGATTIGNSVWIGDSVIVLGGVQIGNGAIVGAGSVVTKSIPAYSVAVGNPAKVIKYRFDSDVIELLEKLAWWDWSFEKIIQHKDLFEINVGEMTVEKMRNVVNDASQ